MVYDGAGNVLAGGGGIYVRVAGTTRLVDEYMIKELLFEGSNRYFDQVLRTGLAGCCSQRRWC